MKTKTLTPWKTLSLGETKDSLRKKLKEYHVSSYASELFDKMDVSDAQEVDLVILTPKDLGFTANPTTTELYARAKKRGYDLCPADVGPVLRVNYDDQPNGEWLYIAMEPITGSAGSPHVFLVKREGDGRRWLDGDWTHPGDPWGLGRRIVFRLRKSSDLNHSETPPSDPLSLELRVEALERIVRSMQEVFKSQEI